MSHSKLSQIILGVVAILIPFIIGCFVWPDIESVFTQKLTAGKAPIEDVQRTQQKSVYIYYKLDEKYIKVNVVRYKTFEYENPNARICLSVNDNHYCVPLDKKSAFINTAGVRNVSLTKHDENDNPSKGLNILEVPGFRF